MPGTGGTKGYEPVASTTVVVGDLHAFVGTDEARLAVDLAGPVADMQLDAVLVVPLPPRQHQLFGIAVGEERRQADAVIGGPRLFAERDDAYWRAASNSTSFSQKRCPTMPLPMTTTVFCRLDPSLAPLIALPFHSIRSKHRSCLKEQEACHVSFWRTCAFSEVHSECET